MWAAVLAAPVVLWLLFWWQPALRSAGVQWPQAVVPVLLMPLLEELAFRGFLQGRLAVPAVRRFSIFRLSGQNLVTTAIFSAFHLVSHTVLWSLAVFFPSLIFGFFRDKYQSVIPSVLLHAWYNGLYFYFFSR